MTAGSIAVPTVIPLRSPIPGLPKSVIDSNVKIEVRTGTILYVLWINVIQILYLICSIFYPMLTIKWISVFVEIQSFMSN